MTFIPEETILALTLTLTLILTLALTVIGGKLATVTGTGCREIFILLCAILLSST